MDLLTTWQLYNGLDSTFYSRFFIALNMKAMAVVEAGTETAKRIKECRTILEDDAVCNATARQFMQKAVLNNAKLQTTGSLEDSDIIWLVGDYLGY